MSKNNDYTTDNLLNYEYFKNHYQLIAIDLSKEIELENPDLIEQFIFLRLGKIMQQCFLLLRKKKKQLLIFHKIL